MIRIYVINGNVNSIGDGGGYFSMRIYFVNDNIGSDEIVAWIMRGDEIYPMEFGR